MPIYNTTIDDASLFIKYEGNWVDSNTEPSAGPSSTASFTFNGTGFYLFRSKQDDHGDYSVSIDGDTQIMSRQVSTSAFQTLLYANPSLPYREHRVVLTNVGASSVLDLDYIITTGDGKSNTVAEDINLDDSALAYGSNWVDTPNEFSPQYLNHTMHRTETADAYATLTFEGNALSLFGATGKNHGMFSVAMDGAAPVFLNGNAPRFRPQKLLYHWDGLADGEHIMTVKNLRPSFLDIDYATVKRYTPLPVTGNNPSSPSSSSDAGNAGNAAEIAGIVVGAFVFLIAVSLGVWWLVRKSLREARRRHGPVQFIPIGDEHDHDYDLDHENNMRAVSRIRIPGQPVFMNPFGASNVHVHAQGDVPPAYVPVPAPAPPPTAYHSNKTPHMTMIPPKKFTRFEHERKASAANLALVLSPTSVASPTPSTSFMLGPNPLGPRALPAEPMSASGCGSDSLGSDGVGLLNDSASSDWSRVPGLPPHMSPSAFYGTDRKFSVVNPSESAYLNS